MTEVSANGNLEVNLNDQKVVNIQDSQNFTVQISGSSSSARSPPDANDVLSMAAAATGQDVWAQMALFAYKEFDKYFQSEGTIRLFNRQCKYSVTGQFCKFQWTWKGQVTCSEWPHIVGTARTKSEKGAVKHAVEDFINKVKNNGLVTEEEVQECLLQQTG